MPKLDLPEILPDSGLRQRVLIASRNRAADGVHGARTVLHSARQFYIADPERPLEDRVARVVDQERGCRDRRRVADVPAVRRSSAHVTRTRSACRVARRRVEIGTRMALGAAPADVIRLVLARVSFLVGVGLLPGVVASLSISRFVASLLYGVEPRDPATLVGAAAVLSVIAGLAGWLPARRASRIDPAAVSRAN